MSFNDIDLKLLKVLHVLLAERSVTRASEVLGRSQPTVSNALRRLRESLDDELLVRGPNGLTLTPRAQTLQQPLHDAMALLEGAILEGSAFDPAGATGVFRVSAPDRLSLPLLPALLDRLERLAPKMRLHLVTADRARALDLLDDDVTDVALGTFTKPPHHFKTQTMLTEGFLCVFRKGHPLQKKRTQPDMATVLSYPHVVVSAAGQDSFFDELLEPHKLSRDIRVRVTSFSTVPHLLERSDMIGIFARLTSNALADSFGLATRSVPMEVGTIVTALAWHVRNDRDKRHEWLRQQIKAVCREFQRSGDERSQNKSKRAS